MHQSGPSSPTGSPPIHHEWTARPGDLNRLARALTRANLTHRRYVISMMVFVAGVAIIAAALYLNHRPLWGSIVVGGGAFAFGTQFVTTPIRSRRHFAALAFPGAQWATGYGPNAILLRTPQTAATMEYSLFASVTPGRGETVLLWYGRRGMVVVLPAELCPPQAQRFLDAAVGSARDPAAPRR